MTHELRLRESVSGQSQMCENNGPDWALGPDIQRIPPESSKAPPPSSTCRNCCWTHGESQTLGKISVVIGPFGLSTPAKGKQNEFLPVLKRGVRSERREEVVANNNGREELDLQP